MASPEKTMAATGSPEPATDSRSRVTIASYSSYGAAERAVDWLSDLGYAVEHVAIVGKGLRSVEHVNSRMSAGRAALIGAGEGALLGSLFALLFGIFFSGPDFGGLLLYSVVAGGLFGCTIGLFTYARAATGNATSSRTRASKRTTTRSRPSMGSRKRRSGFSRPCRAARSRQRKRTE